LKRLTGAMLVVPVIVLCVRFLDIPLALFVKHHLYGNRKWSHLTSTLPDLLLLVVCVTTLIACTLYLTRSKRGIYDALTSFDKLLAWTAPASYLAKSVLKFVFGRVNTRYWLLQPDLYGFHWFQNLNNCEGFPSGHMLVIAALLAAFWRFYPKLRPLCLAGGTLLAVALVATNYHFLSDVLAGAYAGVLVEALVFRLLRRAPHWAELGGPQASA
jgi:membrane-associated phospholipid phosphatase